MSRAARASGYDRNTGKTVELRIYHNRTFVGYLRSAEGGISFTYDSAYLAEPTSFPLSPSLPPQREPQSIRQTERFFEGLLPEGEERRRVARYLRVSSTSLLKLLAALAGDCVGNLTVLAPADDIDRLYEACAYEPLSARDFEDIISNDADLITKITADNRLSIPGAQTKIGLYSGGEPTNSAGQIWYVPKSLSASSRIIKPDSKLYKHTSLNEYICSRLAVLSGIHVLPKPQSEYRDRHRQCVRPGSRQNRRF
jgi:serine/threonine-protein kinase HipA